MKFLLTAILLPSLAAAAILPDAIGACQRGAVSKPAVSDRAIWTEFGLKGSETAVYRNGTARFTVTAWQLQDTTGSLAAFDWQRPAAELGRQHRIIVTGWAGVAATVLLLLYLWTGLMRDQLHQAADAVGWSWLSTLTARTQTIPAADHVPGSAGKPAAPAAGGSTPPATPTAAPAAPAGPAASGAGPTGASSATSPPAASGAGAPSAPVP